MPNDDENAGRIAVSSRRGSLIAAAGCGKTEQIAQATAISDCKRLILTHTHAGVDAIHSRLQKLKVPATKFHLSTIAGWCLQFCRSYPKRSGFDNTVPLAQINWDAVYQACFCLLNSGAVDGIIRASYGGVFVDEYQDCTIRQHDVIRLLAEELPCFVFGDPLQGIFDFSGQVSVDWEKDVYAVFPKQATLIQPHRWINAHNPKLAEWIKYVRTELEQHRPVDLSTRPLCRNNFGVEYTLVVIRESAERSGYAVEGFAPTSRAAAQLRDAGISAETLQAFLARGGQEQFRGDSHSRHLYMVDESSLASTRQMQAFMVKIGPQDRVLLVGDTRQHQSVDAGKPFEQMQQAGMQTSQLDQIMRQKDPELIRAVEHLSKNETASGLTLLQQQGRVTEIPDNVQRIEAIAKDYVAKPENTLVVSPDNASRQEINNAIRAELQASGVVSKENHSMNVLTPRSDMTSVDRSWAARYQPDDVLHYTRGSKEHGIERGSYATVVSANHKENQITVQKPDGQQATYDPKRLQGIAAYREISRDFAQGDRIQFTANNRELAVSNRDMGTIERIDSNQISVKMDGAKERTVTFDAAQMRHFDHGYAVTSHSSQGLTADRVLVNMDTKVHPELINTRFAYVSVSRASEDVRIYTNDVAVLSERLSTDVTKTSAVDLQKAQVEPTHNQQTQTKEPPMTNSREHSQEELRRQILAETIIHAPENISTTAEIEHRHNAPIQAALPKEASDYEWKRETGEVQSYQHTHAGSWLHIDPQGQFYDRQAQPITREAALEQAGQTSAHSLGDNAQGQSVSKDTADIGLSL